MLQDHHEVAPEGEDHPEAGEGEDHHIPQDPRHHHHDLLFGKGRMKLTAMPEVVAGEWGEDGAEETGAGEWGEDGAEGRGDRIREGSGCRGDGPPAPRIPGRRVREGPGTERQRWQSSQPYYFHWQRGGRGRGGRGRGWGGRGRGKGGRGRGWGGCQGQLDRLLDLIELIITSSRN